MMATISSHILNALAGTHASGIRVCFYRLSESGARQAKLFDVVADQEGRISETLVIDSADQQTQYELVFYTADYFNNGTPLASGGIQIMPEMVLKIMLPEPEIRYHIPLVLSPHSYTIWWSGEAQ